MRFKKGTSGNPAGKPKGAKDKRTALRSLLEPHAAKLVRKAVSMALKGDSTALRICIDRLIAPVKSHDAPVVLGALKGTLADHGTAVLAKMAEGVIAPDQAATMMQTIAAQARIVEVDDLERRVALLERGRAGSPGSGAGAGEAAKCH